jgi:hypothetical protein
MRHAAARSMLRRMTAIRLHASPTPRRSRRVIAAIEAVVGLGAVYGGIALLRDAEAFGARREWLAGSVFSDYTIPGIVLSVVIGGGMLASAAITLAANGGAYPLAVGMGATLLVWGTVESATIGYVGGAQVVLLASFVIAPGAALMALGMRGRRTARAGAGR